MSEGFLIFYIVILAAFFALAIVCDTYKETHKPAAPAEVRK